MLDLILPEVYVPLQEVTSCIFWTNASFNMQDLSSQYELDVGSDKEVAQSYSKMVCGGAACYFLGRNLDVAIKVDLVGLL